MSDELEATLGTQAKILYESEAFKNALASVKKAIIEKWATSPIGDRDGQHELRLMLKISNDFEANIVSVINSGKLAEATILASQRIEKSKKEGIRQS